MYNTYIHTYKRVSVTVIVTVNQNNTTAVAVTYSWALRSVDPAAALPWSEMLAWLTQNNIDQIPGTAAARRPYCQ